MKIIALEEVIGKFDDSNACAPAEGDGDAD